MSGSYLKNHYKSLTALLYLFIVGVAFYLMIGSIRGIIVNRYTDNLYNQAIENDLDPTSTGRVAGASTARGEDTNTYDSENPSVLQPTR